MKRVTCHDREAILRDADPAALRALEVHATECAECRAELDMWNEISATARGLHSEWASPALWPRIRQSLAEEMAAGRARESAWAPPLWLGWGRGWQMAAAVLVLSALSVSSVWLLLGTRDREQDLAGAPPVGVTDPETEQRLLTERALRDLERDEARYMQSIERLARLAGPRLESASTPLMANYREKLVVLDAAIAELTAEAGENRFNAHLRGELLALYQEKARTLHAVMREP